MGKLSPQGGERVVDATDCVVYPGWINTHHHLRSLLKGVPQGTTCRCCRGWNRCHKYRTRFDAELLSLARRDRHGPSSCCRAAHARRHHYVIGRASTTTRQILFDLAARFGLRFVLCRGGATLKRRSSPPMRPRREPGSHRPGHRKADRIYHDPGAEAMRRVVLRAAHAEPFSMRPKSSNRWRRPHASSASSFTPIFRNRRLRRVRREKFDQQAGRVRRRPRLARRGTCGCAHGASPNPRSA